MKFIAFILIVSMGFLGLNRFLVAGELLTAQSEMSCGMDCCCSQETSCCDDPEYDHQESDDKAEKDLQCMGGCDCSYSIHITAVATHVQSSIRLGSRFFEHGSIQNHYFFEYLPPHFQPPRMA